MSSPPVWWLIVSGLAFFCSLLFNIVHIVGMIMAWKQLSPILKELQDQIHTIGQKVNSITSTAQNTASTVHERTVRILGQTETTSAEATRKISAVGASLTTLFVALRIVGALRGMMTSGKKKK